MGRDPPGLLGLAADGVGRVQIVCRQLFIGLYSSGFHPSI
jgi:hypothetical protein